jgi:succinylarginine dihydrolase
VRSKLGGCPGADTFLPLCVQKEELTLEEAADCYLFNSQLLTLEDSSCSMLLLAPTDCEEHPRARRVIDRIVGEDNPVQRVEFIDVRQSMRNGGGPACLRLRLVLTEEELASMKPGLILDEGLYEALATWIDRNYREELQPESLSDPQLVIETTRAFEELAEILPLPMQLPTS